MNRIFKIIITNTYHLKCIVIDSENNETIIKLQDNPQEEYTPCISFNDNFISICKEEQENTIHFIQQWLENPENYSLHSILFQNKEYQLLSEVLFALIMYQFKNQVEKQYIIQSTVIELPTNDQLLLQRIKISLEAIKLKGIELENEIHFNYQEQGEQLFEILDNFQTTESYQRMIEKAKDLSKSKEQKLKLQENQKNIYSEETFYQEMTKSFNVNQRSQLKLYSLDNYCIFIASRYFETLSDHINLLFVCKRLRGNMEKFHYNPISVNSKTIHYFPNVETYHNYEKREEYLRVNRVFRYVDWYRVSYHFSLKAIEKYKGKSIEFKNIVWTKEDTFIESEKQNSKKKNDSPISIHIPQCVKEIDYFAFSQNISYVTEIIIPKSITSISKTCFQKLRHLEKLTIPSNNNQIICGNKIFNSPHFDQYIYLPPMLSSINGIKLKNKSLITIPTTVTSLDENCFKGYESYLKYLTIPETVRSIPKKCIENCTHLKSLIIPMNETRVLCWNKIFNYHSHFEQMIYLPSSLKFINGKEMQQIKSLEIPSYVTSIDSDCFYDCTSLKQLTIPDQCTTINSKLFYTKNSCLYSLQLPSSITSINDKEIEFQHIESFKIPNGMISFDYNCFCGWNELKELIIPDSVTYLQSNSLMNLSQLECVKISSNLFTSIGDRLFYDINNSLHSISLPSSLKKVNEQTIYPLESFTIPTNVTQLSEYCFSNCLHLTEIKGLENIKEIGKGCFLNCPKLNRNNYPQINENIKKYFNQFISENEQNQLEQWTSLHCQDILFDSDVDDWNKDTSIFNERIIGKSKLVFLIQDEEGEIFGYYLNTEIKEQTSNKPQKTDSKTFQFNLHFNNYRLKQPMKYEIVDFIWGGYRLYKKSEDWLIDLGNIEIYKQQKKNMSWYRLSDRFNYHHIENALSSKEPIGDYQEVYFNLKRFIVMQMN